MTYNICFDNIFDMETKGKIFASVAAVAVGIVLIIIGIRFIGWLVQALMFGAGGFIIGVICGYIWKGKRMKKKAQVSTEK